MESAGTDMGCGQPVDSPDAISFAHDIPATAPNSTPDPACPHPPHNPFGQLRNPILTAFSPHRNCQHLTARSELGGALPHSPSAKLNHSSRAALPTGHIVSEYESGKRKHKNTPVNHTPA